MIKSIYKKYQYFINLLIFIVGWSILRIFTWLEVQPERFEFIVKFVVTDSICALAICLVMIIPFKWSANKKPWYIPVIIFIIYSAISPTTLFILANTIKYIIWPEGILGKISFKVMLSVTNMHAIFFVIFGGIIYLTFFRLKYIQQKEAALKAQSLAKDTQLKMLSYQINPHFLFNILNSLHALIDENKEIAKKLIIDISEYYRSILNKQVQKHAIKNEVSIIEKYLKIQKIRFEQNLSYEIHVDEDALNIKIPLFIIHLLIENAIKYGLKDNDGKLVIKLDVSMVNNILTITVKNTGIIITESKQNESSTTNGTGTGINNIKERLELFYINDFSFSLTDENNWVVARIEINNINSKNNFK